MAQRDNTSDQDLLARYASGDEDAFAELVVRHGELVRSVCARVLGRAAEADDAAQLAFLALARRAADFSPDMSLPAWLHQTTLYLALRLRHARALRKTREAQKLPAATVPPLDEQADGQRTRSVLMQEVQALPERYRQPLVLHYCDGHSQSEIAAQLGLSYGTVSGRLSRARALLRERLLERGIVAPIALLVLLAPHAVAAREDDAAQWHASVGIPARAEPQAMGFSAVVSQLGAHIYMPMCVMLTLCWCAALLR